MFDQTNRQIDKYLLNFHFVYDVIDMLDKIVQLNRTIDCLRLLIFYRFCPIVQESLFSLNKTNFSLNIE